MAAEIFVVNFIGLGALSAEAKERAY